MIKETDQKTEIGFNKESKLRVLLVLIAVTVLFSWALFGVIYPRIQGIYRFRITVLVLLYGLMAFAIYNTLKQLLSQKPALIIDDTGITDQSSPESVGPIAWTDITEIEETTDFFNHKIIAVFVKNPEEYICRKPFLANALRRRQQQYGTPIMILAGFLDYDYQELLELLKDRNFAMGAK